MIRTFLKEGFTLPKEGTPRTLFLTSPTPAGVADFREAQDAENTVYLPGVLGAVFLNEAMKLVQNTQTEIFLHPLTPEAPQCVRIGDTMLCAEMCIRDSGCTSFCRAKGKATAGILRKSAATVKF